jgi:hypothetical protein
MVMAGHSEAEIVSAIKAAFDNKEVPNLENAGFHDVEVGISNRRRGSQWTTSHVLYPAQGR